MNSASQSYTSANSTLLQRPTKPQQQARAGSVMQHSRRDAAAPLNRASDYEGQARSYVATPLSEEKPDYLVRKDLALGHSIQMKEKAPTQNH